MSYTRAYPNARHPGLPEGWAVLGCDQPDCPTAPLLVPFTESDATPALLAYAAARRAGWTVASVQSLVAPAGADLCPRHTRAAADARRPGE